MVVSVSYCVIMWCWSCDPFIWFSDHVILSYDSVIMWSHHFIMWSYHVILHPTCVLAIMWFLMMIMWAMQLLLQLNGSILYKRYGKWKCKNVSVPAGIRYCCIGLTLTCLCNIALHACWLHIILVKEANHSLVNKWKLFNFTEPMLTYDDPHDYRFCISWGMWWFDLAPALPLFGIYLTTLHWLHFIGQASP